MKLICGLDAIKARFGLDPIGQLLFTTIRLDSGRMVTPVLADLGDTQYLLARQQELGNILSSGVALEDLKLYDPYVTFEDSLKTVAASASFADAVAELAEGAPVTVGEDLPYIHHLAVSKLVDVRVERAADASDAVVVYELDADAILGRFRTWRADGVDIVTPIVSRVAGLEGLSDEFTSDIDTRYSALATMADDLGVSGFLISSPPNFSDITAVRPSPDLAVLWIRESGRVLLIADGARFDTPGTPVGAFASLGEAVAAHVGGALGIEDQWIQIGHAGQLERAGLTLTAASNRLGAWRDARDREDLPFQILAARTSVFCIEGALEYADQQLKAGSVITENDVYRRYLELVHAFRAEGGIPFTIEPYFVNLHASNRMLYPGPPTDFVLDENLKCLMLDAGVKISVDGVVLATSDMARSLMLTDEGIQAYALFKTVVRDGIVGQLVPGAVMADVHEGTMTVVTGIRTQLEELGLLAPEVDFVAQYRKRNVGHLMGKQESFANELRPGYNHVLEVGDLGAAELPWLFDDYAVGTEDMWYIGKSRTYITSLSEPHVTASER
ncbi:MAG TPA: Xaa-Pro aminopeptidase [Microbacteriaceae bacterium]